MTHARRPPGDSPCQLRHRLFRLSFSFLFVLRERERERERERDREDFTSSANQVGGCDSCLCASLWWSGVLPLVSVPLFGAQLLSRVTNVGQD